MSGFVKAGQTFLKALMSGAKQKTTGTGAIKNVPISPNLKKFQEQKDQIIKTTDKYTQGLKQEGKTNVRKFVNPALGRVSKLTQKFPKKVEKKSKGGRVGKMGGGMMGRRMGYKAGSNGSKKGKVPTTPKEKAFGMLSVKKGLDNNKNITFTDKIAGAKKS